MGSGGVSYAVCGGGGEVKGSNKINYWLVLTCIICYVINEQPVQPEQNVKTLSHYYSGYSTKPVRMFFIPTQESLT